MVHRVLMQTGPRVALAVLANRRYVDNTECLDMIERKLGLISLLDEESRLPRGTDESLGNKLHSGHGASGSADKVQIGDGAHFPFPCNRSDAMASLG